MNTIIEKIRAEVERQREEIRPTDTGEMKVVGTPTQLEQGWLNALSWMEKVLDTLQGQPVDLEKEIDDKIRNVFFDLNGIAIAGSTAYASVEDMADIARHFYELGRQSKEQPVCEGLDEEIDKRWKEWLSDDKEQVEGVLPKSEFAFYARHFAKWGENHAKKDEIPVSDNLEEAAKKYAHCPFTDDDGNFHEDAFDGTAYRDFIAGAKWDMEQMMKEAVEKKGVVLDDEFVKFDDGTFLDFRDPTLSINPAFVLPKNGQKVSVIIVKED